LDPLFEAPGLSSSALPAPLRKLYAGGLGFRTGTLYANFVSSLDGVVAIEPLPDSSSVISVGSEADRLVMGLLRALADAVIVGAGTMRAAPDHRWTAQYIYPAQAPAFAEVRAELAKKPDPQLVVVTARGGVNVGHPALEGDALVLTTTSGAERLRGRVPGTTTVQALGDGPVVAPRAIVDAVRAAGHDLLLCEGGATVFGKFLDAGLVDELFLTLSPVIAGRDGVTARPGLVAGVEFPPEDLPRGELLSARRSGSHLFLRFGLGQPSRRAS
jgi:riboflavin biosynthesis pyrimidine reductase